MDISEKLRMMRGEKLNEFSRSLYDGDGRELNAVVAGLIKSGTQADCEMIARIISFAPVAGSGGDYYSARYGKTFDKRYLDFFLNVCKSSGIPESEYIKVLLAAGGADADSDLGRWNSAVDVYLTRLAYEKPDALAKYIDAYDKKYTKYYILVRNDAEAALSGLINKLLFEKNVDKAAIRDALMDHSELAQPLMSLYERSNAKERAAIVRLLFLYKNDASVREFLDGTVKNDKSKTVRGVTARRSSTSKKAIKDAVYFFENAMAEGRAYTYAEWKEILKDEKCAAVADRVFFCMKDDGLSVLVYNDGKFLNMQDIPQKLGSGDSIYVLHPLDLPADSEIFSMRISQPFPQISRKIYAPMHADDYYSDVLSGTLISSGEFEARAKKTGFIFCGKRSAAESAMAVCFLGAYAIGVEYFTDGELGSVSCGKIYYYSSRDVVRINRTRYVSQSQPYRLGRVPKREFSELMLLARRLFARD